MNTKLLARKTIIGGVTAALMLGGFSLSQGKAAYAAEVRQPAPVSPIVTEYLNHLVSYSSWVAGLDEEHVRYEVSAGNNIAEATGLPAAELLEKLIDNFNSYIESVQSEASAEDVQKLKEEASREISVAIAQKGYEPAEGNATVDFNAVIQQRLHSIVSDVAAIADQDYESIESQIQSGATLVKASGLPQLVLFDALNSLMNQSIDAAVGQLPVDSDKIQQAKQEAAEKIAEAITTGGGPVNEQTSATNLSEVIRLHLASIISDAANMADKDYNDVLQSVKAGATIPQAVGMSQGELAAQLKWLMDQSINNAGAADAAAVEQAKSDAAKQIDSILSQAGYSTGKPVDDAHITAQVQDRLKLIVLDAATIADQELIDVQDLVDAGSSLAGATGLSGEVLLAELTSLIDQYIEGLTSDADAQAKAKADAAEQIKTWVHDGFNNNNN